MKADRIADPWGARMPYGRHEVWPSRVDTYLAQGVEPGAVQKWVGAASLLHSGGDATASAPSDPDSVPATTGGRHAYATEGETGGPGDTP